MSQASNNDAAAVRRERIREGAEQAGFAACGFTTSAPGECEVLLRDWIEQGRHGTMDFLACSPSRRLDPREALVGARSVVVVAWPYPAPPAPDPDWKSKLTGRIASYAHGADYHDVLREKLSELADTLLSIEGARFAIHVDAGPLMEKEFARRAGIGWYGRNTNILNKKLGSYFLLGCIITDAELDADPPFNSSHCGDCTACIPACPTGALDAGPTIDARLCISYLTIEHRGPIAHELRAPIGNWIFGCDVCQEVCPWHGETADSNDFLQPSLVEILEIDRDDFRERYRRTAVARTKRRGLARNAAVALGNSANPAAIGPLGRALVAHDEALVRAHCAWALGQLGLEQAAAALHRGARTRQVPPVAAEIDAALMRLKSH